MRLLKIIRVMAVVFSGLLAGVYLGDRFGATPARAALNPSSFVQFQQILHLHFARLLPLLTLGAALAGLAWLVMLWRNRRTIEFWLVAASTIGILFIIVVTRAVNVPINDQLMTWSVSAPPPNLRELWSAWDQIHTIRTTVAIVAFFLEVVALNLGRPNHPAANSLYGAASK